MHQSDLLVVLETFVSDLLRFQIESETMNTYAIT